MIGNAQLNFEEVKTIITEVENAINSRPFTYLSDENHEEALTPFHLIFGRNINSKYVVTCDVESMSADKMTTSSRRMEVVMAHFMSRFYKEYITALRERHILMWTYINVDIY